MSNALPLPVPSAPHVFSICSTFRIPGSSLLDRFSMAMFNHSCFKNPGEGSGDTGGLAWETESKRCGATTHNWHFM